MKTVEIKCPKSLNLTNIVGLKENNKKVLQTIDIYDKVSMTSYPKKENGIYIKSNSELDDNLKNDIKRIIDIFVQYTNISITNLEITIKKNEIDLMNNYYNILACILIGLNVYFKTNLHTHELVYLSKSINNLIGYYIECGYKKIDINNKYYNIGENKYKKYVLFLDNIKEELMLIKQRIIELDNNLIKTDFNNDYFFIALPSNYKSMIGNIPISIKKEFKEVKLLTAENACHNKVFVKYLNKFE